jgi:hypothetical protein
METDALKKYLAALIDGHKAIHTANQIRKSIKQRINHLRSENENAIEAKPQPPVMPALENTGVNVLKAIGIGSGVFVGGYFVVGCVVGIIGFLVGGIGGGVFAGVGVLCLLAACGVSFAYVLSGIKGNSEVKAAYKKAQEQYPQLVEAHKEKIRQREGRNKANIEAIADLQRENEIVASTVQDAEATLGELYAKDIIFGKYRRFVAVASFYEYIMSGRCDSLEGRDGAYNLYESELRQNIIIGKLDEAVGRLEEIRDAQYVLYAAIQESNRISREIASEVSEINSRVAAIGRASETTAKMSKLSAFYAAESARNRKILVDLNRGDFDTLVTKGGRNIIG